MFSTFYCNDGNVGQQNMEVFVIKKYVFGPFLAAHLNHLLEFYLQKNCSFLKACTVVGMILSHILLDAMQKISNQLAK